MKNYGNSFSGGRESLDAGKIPVWNSVDELYPSGCTLNTQTADTVIPAGTAVYVDKMGGEAVVYDSTETLTRTEGNDTVYLEVTGLLLEDVYIGSDGATGTVVTKGSILSARAATLSAAVKNALSGRITFIAE